MWGTLRRARAEPGKAEQAQLNFYQKREDARTQQTVHGTEADSGLTYLGKDSAPQVQTRCLQRTGRKHAQRSPKLPGRHEEEARPSARAGRRRRAESPRPVLGNSGGLGPRERPPSLLKTATSAGARPRSDGRAWPAVGDSAPPSPQICGQGSTCEQRLRAGGRP